MKYKELVYVDSQKLAFWQDVLNRKGGHPDYDRDGIIDVITIVFENGHEADLKLCNVNHDNEESSPYIDPVLFDSNGCEECVSEVEDQLDNLYEFFDNEGNTYEIEIKIKETAEQVS